MIPPIPTMLHSQYVSPSVSRIVCLSLAEFTINSPHLLTAELRFDEPEVSDVEFETDYRVGIGLNIGFDFGSDIEVVVAGLRDGIAEAGIDVGCTLLFDYDSIDC